MNEDHHEAYLKLIQTLLTHPHEVPKILGANWELLDEGLVQTITQKAKELAQLGDQNAADLLIDVVSQLAKGLGLEPPPPDFSISPSDSPQVKLLARILQTIAENNGNPQAVYPLLQANLDKLDEHFIQVLRNPVKTIQSNTDKSTQLAKLIGIFSEYIWNVPLDNKGSHLKIAIAGCESVLQLDQFETHPQKLATIQSNLAMLYFMTVLNHISTNKEQDIERAIDNYKKALEFFTPHRELERWAKIQHDLAVVYLERVYGNKMENLKQAIEYLEKILEVGACENHPKLWADTQTELAIAYRDLGDYYRKNASRPDGFDLEIIYEAPFSNFRTDAITCFKNALQVLTFETYPVDWAKAQFNLGNTYLKPFMEEGDKERAIVCFQNALRVYTPDTYPTEYAAIQISLGNVHLS
jgi:tetratricopeptide (TPR) repeat protein